MRVRAAGRTTALRICSIKFELPPEVFQHRTFTRLKQLEYLIRTKQIDGKFLLERTGAIDPDTGNTSGRNQSRLGALFFGKRYSRVAQQITIMPDTILFLRGRRS